MASMVIMSGHNVCNQCAWMLPWTHACMRPATSPQQHTANAVPMQHPCMTNFVHTLCTANASGTVRWGCAHTMPYCTCTVHVLQWCFTGMIQNLQWDCSNAHSTNYPSTATVHCWHDVVVRWCCPGAVLALCRFCTGAGTVLRERRIVICTGTGLDSLSWAAISRA